MKKFLIPLLIIFFIFSNYFVSYADNASELQGIVLSFSDDEEISANNCLQTLMPKFDSETLLFMQFLDQTFQNKSSTSSLVNIAIIRYREYKSVINGLMATVSVADSDANMVETNEENFKSYDLCQKYANSYIHSAKEIMIKRIKTTSSQKKATIFVEKYKSINDGLRKLHFSLSEMYSYFMTFKNKLPGFICDQCISK